MTPHNELRLLPWLGPDDKPCYLSTDDQGGHLSRLADSTEAIQLNFAAALVAHAMEVLRDEAGDLEELQELSADLTEALKDVLRVATIRGRRLPALDLTTREEGEIRRRLSASSSTPNDRAAPDHVRGCPTQS
ncbi:hypothetical protein [Streptomyces sp. CB02261]|uniref:hypothetical protein n=1 Tax=Streptomyces sp. CB02261 TaxID=1703940 RepID=UPI00093D86B7|nr:hypothetical protein [Streptomyces sp. CB02261]OKJ69361.1 hypothetical protein AMK29_02700 [Streptomyces sp. CB02261]